MNVDSYAAEGSPQQCPFCEESIEVDPSCDSLDAPCPSCGQLLWISNGVIAQNSLTGIYHYMLEGNENAARKLWQACFPILLPLAQKHLQGVPQKMADAEDIVQEAMASFIKAAQLGRFPDFKDRDDLWRLLFTITKRKAIDLRRKESRRRTSGQSALGLSDDGIIGLQGIPADLSEQEAARLLTEVVEEGFKRLDKELLPYALAKLEGLSNQEIAVKFNIALRTVERKLHLIRRMWWDENEMQ